MLRELKAFPVDMIRPNELLDTSIARLIASNVRTVKVEVVFVVFWVMMSLTTSINCELEGMLLLDMICSVLLLVQRVKLLSTEPPTTTKEALATDNKAISEGRVR